MQEQIGARAGLNGSGAGYEFPSANEAGVAGGEGGTTGGSSRSTSLAMSGGVEEGAPRPRYPLVALMRDPATRAELKRRVTETDESYQSMADWLGVSRGAIQSHAKRQAWPRPPTARGGHAAPSIELATLDQNAQLIRARLLQAIVRQVDKVDARLRKRDAEVDEKDSRVLGNLAKTLSTLMQMGEGGTTAKEMERPNRAEVEARLAERIRRWARGEEGSE